MRVKVLGAVALLLSIFVVSVPSASAAPACDGKIPVNSCAGVTSDGAPYAMQVPANFNGTVLIYSHGYRPNVDVPAGIPGYGGYKVTNTPETAPGQGSRDLTVTNYLLSKGYALAGSGFARQGWNADSALATNKELISTFKSQFPTTKKVMAWGQSLGGIITQLMQEKYPDQINVAAPLCVADNISAELKMAGDFLWGFKVLFDPSIKAGNYSAGAAGYAESMQDLVKVFTVLGKLQAKITTNDWPDTASDLGKSLAADGVSARAALLMLGLMSGIPTQSAHFDGASGPKGPNELTFAFGVSPALAVLENGANAAALAVLATHDLELQTGGAVFDNSKTDYSTRVAGSSLAFSAALGGDAGISKLLKAIASAPRAKADPAAVAKLKTLTSHSGQVEIPTILFTGTADPVTTAGNQQSVVDKYAEYWAEKWAAAKKAGIRTKPVNNQLVLWNFPPEKYTKFTALGSPDTTVPAATGTNHCNFTVAQHLAIADMLAYAADNGKNLSGGALLTKLRKAGNMTFDRGYAAPRLKALGG